MWRFTNFVSRGLNQKLQDIALRTPKDFSLDEENKKKERVNKCLKEVSEQSSLNISHVDSLEQSYLNSQNLNSTSFTTTTSSFESTLKENESKLNHMIGLSFLKDGNYIKALPWIKSSSELGNPKAQFNLALCYEQGLGVKQDYEKARFYYLKSADAGHAVAQYNLGIFYANGLGGSPSISKSRHYLQKAAQQGVP